MGAGGLRVNAEVDVWLIEHHSDRERVGLVNISTKKERENTIIWKGEGSRKEKWSAIFGYQCGWEDTKR